MNAEDRAVAYLLRQNPMVAEKELRAEWRRWSPEAQATILGYEMQETRKKGGEGGA